MRKRGFIVSAVPLSGGFSTADSPQPRGGKARVAVREETGVRVDPLEWV
jgi:hypothetical protein